MSETVASSHRSILRSSSIIGGAAVINIVVGLAKTKVVALLLGPAGLGVIVLLQNLLQTAASIAGMGLGQAGTRTVAEAAAAGDDRQVALVRRSLVAATLALGAGSAVLMWFASDPLAEWVEPGHHAGWQVRWLALGVAATVASQTQTAMLMGFRRVGDLARVSILSVMVSALLGVGALWWRADDGVVAFVLVQALATFAIGQIYVARLPKARPDPAPPGVGAVTRQLIALLSFGAALTVAAMCVNIGQLFARTLIQQKLGEAAVGQFQASWLISVTYIGFVLQAMGTDFYPRIAAASNDTLLLRRLVNEQIEVALLLAAPVLLGMMAVAPWLVGLLYARSFEPAVAVLQWQVLGDILKVASWPLGYLLLATKASKTFMAAEIGAIAVLLAALWLLLPALRLEASGISVLMMYAVYLPGVYAISASSIGFRFTRSNAVLLINLFAAGAVVMALSRISPPAGAGVGCLLAAGAAGWCIRRLHDALPTPVQKVIRISPRWLRDRLGH